MIADGPGDVGYEDFDNDTPGANPSEAWYTYVERDTNCEGGVADRGSVQAGGVQAGGNYFQHASATNSHTCFINFTSPVICNNNGGSFWFYIDGSLTGDPNRMNYLWGQPNGRSAQRMGLLINSGGTGDITFIIDDLLAAEQTVVIAAAVENTWIAAQFDINCAAGAQDQTVTLVSLPGDPSATINRDISSQDWESFRIGSDSGGVPQPDYRLDILRTQPIPAEGPGFTLPPTCEGVGGNQGILFGCDQEAYADSVGVPVNVINAFFMLLIIFLSFALGAFAYGSMGGAMGGVFGTVLAYVLDLLPLWGMMFLVLTGAVAFVLGFATKER